MGAEAVVTGLDVASVADVERAVSTQGRRYLDRVYTATEQRALTAGGPAALAARYAGKEAVLKVLGPDGLDPRDVEVVTDAAGCPTVRLHGDAAVRARERGVASIRVGLTHGQGVAIAVALAEVSSVTTAARGSGRRA